MGRIILGRPLLKSDIEIANQHSRSAAEAARYLSVSYPTFKKYAKMYGLFITNPTGKGIPRPKMRGAASLKEILEGKRPTYPPKKLKERIIRAGILPNECALCGYKEVRPDGRGPFTLYLIDGDRHNLRLDNLQLRCYNCMYITTGKVDPNLLAIGPQVYEQDITELSDPNMDIEEVRLEAIKELEREKED